jgi:hypothetical protein
MGWATFLVIFSQTHPVTLQDVVPETEKVQYVLLFAGDCTLRN